MNKFLIGLMLTVISVVSFNASASHVEGKTWFLLGADVGFVNKSSVTAPEITNSGYDLGLRAIVSRYFSKWVVDGALGYDYSKLSKDGVEVKTNAFLLDASARYRISEHWSVGPVLTALLGKDVSFSDVATNSDDKSSSIFLGAKAMYDWHVKGWCQLVRAGLQVQTDINIDNRQVTSAMVIAEMGWPFGARESAPVRKKVMPRVIEEKAVVQPVVVQPVKILETKEPAPSFELNLMSAGVKFAVNSSRLVGSSRQTIERIAALLVKYKDDWQRVSIAGHTDKTGNYKANINLSRMRAERVADVLGGNGVAPERVTFVGYGPDQPLDNAETKFAYARNRRVELKFFGVKKDSELVTELRRL